MPTSLTEKALAALPAKAAKGQKDLLKELAANMAKEDWQHFDPELLATVTTTHTGRSHKKEMTMNQSLKFIAQPAQTQERAKQLLMSSVMIWLFLLILWLQRSTNIIF